MKETIIWVRKKDAPELDEEPINCTQKGQDPDHVEDRLKKLGYITRRQEMNLETPPDFTKIINSGK